jgi:predicted nucleotidyltransferase
MRETLFKTVHGSRLYGLANENSDEDFYTVVTKVQSDTRWGRQTRARYAKQKINGTEDSMVVDFGTWVEMCKSGVPQALEAMFSTLPVGDDRIADFRASFRVGTEVYERYFRTIKSFALQEDETIKKRRHSLRLALNMNEMARTGRFNPTLSQEDARFVTLYATKSHEDVYGLAKCIAW